MDCDTNIAAARRRIILAILFSTHTGLVAYAATTHSPTYNEPAHLAAGIYYWDFGRFDVYNVNPPLVRIVAAAPVKLVGCETDWSHYQSWPGSRLEMALGSDFCEANGERTFWLMTLARWACLPFSLLGGFVCYRWARDLYGNAAGLLSLTLWCFSPNIIAHGQLITTDVAASSLGAAACYAYWRWLRSPTWLKSVYCGVTLGLACLAKTTLLILFPLWPIIWLMYRWTGYPRTDLRTLLHECGRLCISCFLGVYVINLGYGFEGSGTKLGEFKFQSRVFTVNSGEASERRENCFANSPLCDVPVPLPANYLLGIDLQRRDFESYRSQFYLGGVWSSKGWWYYYIYALAIKVPIGSWILIFAPLILRLLLPVSVRDTATLLAPAILIFVVVSSQTGMNEHMRYTLPVFPFLFIWAGQLAECFRSCSNAPVVGKTEFCRRLVVIAVTWSVLANIASYPHSLSYFNEIIGGPRNGWKHLTNSNIDWGQDLLYLRRWAKDHPQSKPLKTAIILTLLSPELIGIEAGESEVFSDNSGLSPGFHAVGMTTLSGFGQTDHGAALRAELGRSAYREQIGGSIIVFLKD